MALILKGGTVVTMNRGREVLSDYDLLLDGETLVKIAPTGSITKGHDTEELSCHGKIILPGLVSAHSHLSGLAQRGLWQEKSFESWSAKTFALDNHVDFSTDEIYLIHCAACIEFVRHGVTTVLDMFTAHRSNALDKVDAACKAIIDTGLRGVLAYSFRDQSPDNREVVATSISTQSVFATTRQVAEGVHGRDARLGFMLAPSAPQRCSDELLRSTEGLAQELGIGVHTHLAEAKNHAEVGKAIYGEPIVKHLERLGWLNANLSVAHAVWLDDEEISLLAKYDVKVVHNPAANLRLGSGMARVKQMIRSGVSVGLGCDSVNAGTNYSVFEQMKLATLMPRSLWPAEEWLVPDETLEMATLGGARALLLDRIIGSIEEGKKADLVILNPSSSPSLLPLNNIVDQLVLAESGASVETVFVDGKAVMLNGRIKTIDEERVKAKVSSLQPRIGKAHAAVMARSF
jgi:5-methylthioadenosine/S-adenosylhomocysteine deaminase